jgi:site-specific DNA recombinase
MKTAAIYARVSSDQQREEKTIASQTAALVEFSESKGYSVPAEWIFQDEGYSGANLVRPGLERVRDLAAEGQIQAVLVLSPDRLSRKYAYQVLLLEELARNGVQVVFIKAPQSDSPEDQLLLQFQGMIAEYERAQILERSRRGKVHRARQGEVSVLSGAPYGYRYVRKTDEHTGYYEVIEAEAQVVRQAYEWYTTEGLSIGDVTRRINDLGVPTKKHGAKWERSTVWAMLRNPAYKGTACFGKTKAAPRQRADNRLSRQRGHVSARNSASHELPREQWIEITVPGLVEANTFALAQERLASNKKLASRRTIEPSILQGLVHCSECGYALYRTTTRSSARKISYYRCLGSDAWRYEGKARCDQRPIRLDLLEHIVWAEIERLLEDPALLNAELNRRLEAARNANPAQRREETLTLELAQTNRRMERLLTAYQEELLSLDELRRRMPELRQREQRQQTELNALHTQVADQVAYLRLAQTLSSFLENLRTNIKTLDVNDRQRITRLLVKEVIVGYDNITIRHSIPNAVRSTSGNPGSSGLPSSKGGAMSDTNYLLCPWSDFTPAQ